MAIQTFDEPFHRVPGELPPRDAGIAFMQEAGVTFLVLGRGEVVVAGYQRNLERTAKALTDARALMSAVDGTEFLVVDITAKMLRERVRTTWAFPGVSIDIDLEPLPGLDYGTLLMDAEPLSPDEGNEIIREACKWSPELAAACEVWKEITFNFPTIDKLDGQE